MTSAVKRIIKRCYCLCICAACHGMIRDVQDVCFSFL
jgi:hypothetical protein